MGIFLTKRPESFAGVLRRVAEYLDAGDAAFNELARLTGRESPVTGNGVQSDLRQMAKILTSNPGRVLDDKLIYLFLEHEGTEGPFTYKTYCPVSVESPDTSGEWWVKLKDVPKGWEWRYTDFDIWEVSEPPFVTEALVITRPAREPVMVNVALSYDVVGSLYSVLERSTHSELTLDEKTKILAALHVALEVESDN